MMSGTKWLLVLVLMLGATLSYSCGGGDDDDDDTKKEDEMKDDEPKAGSAAPPMAAEGEVLCGQAVCKVPEGSTAVACCADAFASMCGMMNPAAPNCVPVVENFEGCPGLMGGMGFLNLASCCTDGGQCGLDTTMFGGMGCTDLAEVQAMLPPQAMNFIMVPTPMACP